MASLHVYEMFERCILQIQSLISRARRESRDVCGKVYVHSFNYPRSLPPQAVNLLKKNNFLSHMFKKGSEIPRKTCHVKSCQIHQKKELRPQRKTSYSCERLCGCVDLISRHGVLYWIEAPFTSGCREIV